MKGVRPLSGQKGSDPFFVVLVTCPSQAVARRVAGRLIARRVAACVNIVPGLTSVYRWKGRVEHAREVLLIIKTTGGAFERLRREVLAAHPYEVPEVIAVPVVAGHAPYMRWVREGVRPRLA